MYYKNIDEQLTFPNVWTAWSSVLMKTAQALARPRQASFFPFFSLILFYLLPCMTMFSDTVKRSDEDIERDTLHAVDRYQPEQSSIITLGFFKEKAFLLLI
jgi:hypothetical protein